MVESGRFKLLVKLDQLI